MQGEAEGGGGEWDRAMLESEDSRVSFPMAEALAFGTLALKRTKGPEAYGALSHHDMAQEEKKDRFALEGLNLGSYSVRLSGQDVERGTFNQRHAVLYDQVTGERCVPPFIRRKHKSREQT